MNQEVITPQRAPKSGKQAFSPVGCFIAAAGATLVTLCLVGSAVIASVWAFSKMLGFPDVVILALLAIAVIPVLMITFWTAGRAWYVERRLAQGLDIDTPVFKTAYYWRKQA